MEVALAPESQQFVQEQLKAGKYRSAEEFIGAGLELLRRRQAALSKIQADISVGMEQALRGELLDGEQVLDDQEYHR